VTGLAVFSVGIAAVALVFIWYRDELISTARTAARLIRRRRG